MKETFFYTYLSFTAQVMMMMRIRMRMMLISIMIIIIMMIIMMMIIIMIMIKMMMMIIMMMMMMIILFFHFSGRRPQTQVELWAVGGRRVVALHLLRHRHLHRQHGRLPHHLQDGQGHRQLRVPSETEQDEVTNILVQDVFIFQMFL